MQSDQIKGLLANMTFAQQEHPSPLPQAGQVIVNRSQLPNPHGLFNVSDKVMARQAAAMHEQRLAAKQVVNRQTNSSASSRSSTKTAVTNQLVGNKSSSQQS